MYPHCQPWGEAVFPASPHGAFLSLSCARLVAVCGVRVGRLFSRVRGRAGGVGVFSESCSRVFVFARVWARDCFSLCCGEREFF